MEKIKVLVIFRNLDLNDSYISELNNGFVYKYISALEVY